MHKIFQLMAINRFYLFCSFFIVILFGACTNSRLYTSQVAANQLEDLHYFPPVGYISYIEKGNRGEYNEEISQQLELLTTSILISNAGIYKLTDSIHYKFPDDQINANNDLWTVIDEIEFTNAINGITIPPSLKFIMQENDTRFAMAVMVDGFVRRKGNYTGEVLKSIGLGIVTFGMFYTVPVKSISTIRVLILDAYNEEIVFYRKNIMQDKSPLDPKVIDKQVNKIFKGYYY